MAEVGRGEIWHFSFPSPDRRRPVLILTRREMIRHLTSVTVAPITRTVRGVPSEVVIGEESGLKTVSAINLHNLATVPKQGLRAYVGTVSPGELEKVREALLFALGFDDRQGLAESVARYVAAGHADEDTDLIGAQAFEVPRRSSKRRRSNRTPA